MRRLEIGSGDFPAYSPPDWEQLDVRPLPHVQHVCDARHLPFENATFVEIYSSQTLEHFSWREIDALLAEWVRVLVPGGLLRIRTIDILGMFGDFLTGKNSFEFMVERIYGGQDYSENLHRAAFSEEGLMRVMEQIGLEEISITRTHEGGGLYAMGRKIL